MKKKDTSLKPRNSGTWIRTIIMVLVFLNQVTALAGKLTFFSEGVLGTVYLIISVVLTFITMLLVYWYNNDWTGAASLATDFFNMISDGKITPEEAAEFMAKHHKDLTNKDKDDGGNSQ